MVSLTYEYHMSIQIINYLSNLFFTYKLMDPINNPEKAYSIQYMKNYISSDIFYEHWKQLNNTYDPIFVAFIEELKNTNLPLYNFLLNKWYFDELYDVIFIIPIKKIGSFFWKTCDQGIIDKFGPDGISKIIKMISNKAVRFQTGYIYDYAFVMLIGLSILLTYLILH